VLNEISGLSYVDKLLAPMPVGGAVGPNGRPTPRGIGPTSLGPLLGRLAVKLVLIEDPEQLPRNKRCARYARRDEVRVKAACSESTINGMLNHRLSQQRSELAQRGGHARREALTPEQRKAIASKAARIRWNIERAERGAEGAAAT
jgi:hypothetical protein